MSTDKRVRRKEFTKAKTRRAITRSKNLVKGSHERIARSREIIDSKSNSRKDKDLKQKSA